MGLFGEFRQFIARGNVVDLAVGVIIGGAFGKIVTSLVDQVIMPPIGFLTGGVDFAALKWVLAPDNPALKKPETAILYGAFLNTVIQFLIIAPVISCWSKPSTPSAARRPSTPRLPPPRPRANNCWRRSGTRCGRGREHGPIAQDQDRVHGTLFTTAHDREHPHLSPRRTLGSLLLVIAGLLTYFLEPIRVSLLLTPRAAHRLSSLAEVG